MHWLDTTLLLLLVCGAVLGFRSGLLWQVARIISLIGGTYAAILFHEPAVSLVRERILQGADARVTDVVAYGIVFIVTYGALLLIGRACKSLISLLGLGWIDGFLGAALGAAKATILVAGICLLAGRLHHPEVEQALAESKLASQMSDGLEKTLALIPDDAKRNLADAVTQLANKTPLGQ
jgi:membrane protein required for colicin V production